MVENFKDIKGYAGKYKISNFGRVYSTYSNKYMSFTDNGNGYLIVKLMAQAKPIKKYKTYYVHRLVAEAFIPNIYNKCCVNHIDGDKSNNKVINLEWVSRSENMQHAVATGLFNKKSKMDGIDLEEFVISYITDNFSLLEYSKKVGYVRKNSLVRLIKDYLKKKGKIELLMEFEKKIREESIENQRKNSENTPKRPVVAISVKEPNLKLEFVSLSEAASYVGATPSNIKVSADKNSKGNFCKYICKGFYFKYKNN